MADRRERRDELLEALDRPSDLGREERRENVELREAVDGNVAPVDVDQVVDEFEREERDAERQDPVEQRRIELGAERGVRGARERPDEEVEVFEDAEDREVQRDEQRQKGSTPIRRPAQDQAEDVVDDDEPEDHGGVGDAPARVEDVAGDEHPLEATSRGYRPEDDPGHGEEDQIREAVEEHG